MPRWPKRRDDLEQTTRDNGDGSMSVIWTKRKEAPVASIKQMCMCEDVAHDREGPGAEPGILGSCQNIAETKGIYDGTAIQLCHPCKDNKHMGGEDA